jgi:hypothetical protein
MKTNFFTSLKSLKKGVGFGVGFGSGSISQRYGSGHPDPHIKMSRIPNTKARSKEIGKNQQINLISSHIKRKPFFVYLRSYVV